MQNYANLQHLLADRQSAVVRLATESNFCPCRGVHLVSGLSRSRKIYGDFTDYSESGYPLNTSGLHAKSQCIYNLRKAASKNSACRSAPEPARDAGAYHHAPLFGIPETRRESLIERPNM